MGISLEEADLQDKLRNSGLKSRQLSKPEASTVKR
jgi:hypothetical protein